MSNGRRLIADQQAAPNQRECLAGAIAARAQLPSSLATNLRTLRVDLKIAQECSRHVSSRTTLEIYNSIHIPVEAGCDMKVVELMLSGS